MRAGHEVLCGFQHGVFGGGVNGVGADRWRLVARVQHMMLEFVEQGLPLLPPVLGGRELVVVTVVLLLLLLGWRTIVVRLGGRRRFVPDSGRQRGRGGGWIQCFGIGWLPIVLG